MPKVKGLPVPSSILADEATSSKDLDSMRISHTRAADAVTPSSSVTAAPTRSLRSSQQPIVSASALAPAPAAGSPALLSNIVALKDWSFAKNPTSRHLGFRAKGTLVHHPKHKESSYGSDWFSTEIRAVHSNGIVVSSNNTLYRLDGPAAPARHKAQDRLAKIMQPFCRSTWPSNAQSLLEQVSVFFRSDGYVSTLPQPSRASATPVSELSDKRGSGKKDVVEYDDDDEGDEDDEDVEEDEEDDDDEPPPPRRKPSAASKQKPRASATKVKASVKAVKASVSKRKAKAKATVQPPPGPTRSSSRKSANARTIVPEPRPSTRSRSETTLTIVAAAAVSRSGAAASSAAVPSGSSAGTPNSASLPPLVDQTNLNYIRQARHKVRPLK